MNSIMKGKNPTIIGQVVKVNLEVYYCSKLRHSLRTGHTAKNVELCLFSDLSLQWKSCLCQYVGLWVYKNLNSLSVTKVQDQIASGYFGHQKTVSLLCRNCYSPKMKVTIYCYIRNYHPCKGPKAFEDQYNSLLKLILILIYF